MGASVDLAGRPAWPACTSYAAGVLQRTWPGGAGVGLLSAALEERLQGPGIDLTGEQCDTLTRFVASLPKPGVRPEDSQEQADAIEHGRQLFVSVGCAACHRPKLGDVDGIYSDLLLHDMGRQNSDSGSYTVLEPESASKDKSKQPRAANEREWRTPPLWGLRDSAPYLQDGRAEAIADAIALHGGEGLSAARAYKRLSEKEREQVDLFLQTLAAPPTIR
jgi:CxxC motif-containing protein (DUF1111 family)